MPLGERITDTGLLLMHGHTFVLERDEGGTWRLDTGGRHRKMLGHRVVVEGVRDGFDLLSVDKIRPA